jgi:hypothetical protein
MDQWQIETIAQFGQIVASPDVVEAVDHRIDRKPLILGYMAEIGGKGACLGKGMDGSYPLAPLPPISAI